MQLSYLVLCNFISYFVITIQFSLTQIIVNKDLLGFLFIYFISENVVFGLHLSFFQSQYLILKAFLCF